MLRKLVSYIQGNVWVVRVIFEVKGKLGAVITTFEVKGELGKPGTLKANLTLKQELEG